jgi:site-specific DNA-methyltransferase (adenine-specific)
MSIDLYHGDCITKMNSMSDGSVDLIVTDPPYLMDYQSNMRVKTDKFEKIAGDVDGHQLIRDYFSECNRILKDNTHIYSFCSWHHIDFFKQEFEKFFKLKNIMIWYKGGGGIGDLEGSYSTDYEFILFGHKGRKELNRKALGKRTSGMLKFKKVFPGAMVHATEKPVDLIELMIKASSDKDDIVFDGFMGAGSHGMAAVRNQRGFVGCELEQGYFDTAKDRIESASCTLESFFE